MLFRSASMFQQMAVAWYVGVPWLDTPSEHHTALDFREVLEMTTINGARALGLESATGSLKIGKRADIVMVRMDALNVTPIADVFAALGRAGTAANVDTVMVDGRILKRGGKLVGLDVAAIVANANATLNDLRARAGGMWAVPPQGI